MQNQPYVLEIGKRVEITYEEFEKVILSLKGKSISNFYCDDKLASFLTFCFGDKHDIPLRQNKLIDERYDVELTTNWAWIYTDDKNNKITSELLKNETESEFNKRIKAFFETQTLTELDLISLPDPKKEKLEDDLIIALYFQNGQELIVWADEGLWLTITYFEKCSYMYIEGKFYKIYTDKTPPKLGQIDKS